MGYSSTTRTLDYTTSRNRTKYEYNDAGLRVKATETVDAGTPVVTVYHFDNNNHTGYAQVLEQAVDGNSDGRINPGELDHADAKVFTLGHDVIAQYAGTIAAGELLAFLYDLHGSTRALVDTASLTRGQIKNHATKGTQAFTYDAYGKFVNIAFGAATQADALTSLLYSGEFTSAATGQQYLRARFYDPTTGRFNRLDPFAGNTSDPLSLHKYLYANGNPILNGDPTGNFALVMTLITMTAGTYINTFGAANAGKAWRAGLEFQSYLASNGVNSTSPLTIRQINDRLSFSGHFVLDVLGLIPVVGVVFDAANAIWYTTEGDYVNAAISAVAAVPGAGYIAAGATGSKWVYRGAKYADIGVNVGFSAVGIVKGIQDENYLMFTFGVAGVGLNALYAIKFRGGPPTPGIQVPKSKVVTVPGTGPNLGGAAFRAPDGTVYMGVLHNQVAEYLYEQRIWKTRNQPDGWEYGFYSESDRFIGG